MNRFHQLGYLLCFFLDIQMAQRGLGIVAVKDKVPGTGSWESTHS